jgi:predicted enzyme related to lactoylglutathione lyase
MASTAPAVERDEVSFRLNEFVIDCRDPQQLARFWNATLGYEVCEWDGDFAAIEDPDGSGPTICFQKVAEDKLSKNRIHFDLDVPEGTLEAAIARLVGLGARRVNVGQRDDCSWAVMADPEGNEFCVVA